MGVVEIPLTQGAVALVDEEDAAHLLGFKWLLYRPGHGRRYAGRRVAKSHDHGALMAMHRVILAAPQGFDVDHIDGDGLNNTRANLRIATRSQNMANIPKRPGCSSQFKGVSWNKRSGRWVANIGHNNRVVYLGGFTSELQAALAYDRAARDLFGEFARLNFAQDIEVPRWMNPES